MPDLASKMPERKHYTLHRQRIIYHPSIYVKKKKKQNLVLYSYIELLSAATRSQQQKSYGGDVDPL